ncbi:hypothetical protein R1flu_001091 [Riccia fluitans]|uniref:Golgi apparatus membrane protein TVP15 n=1 Tax=Riccia fluitans TaxID=41844 RepID=A0ABD1Y2B2_9MARC
MGQEKPAVAQPQHHVDVGEYHPPGPDPDDELDENSRTDTMDAALLMFRALTLITVVSALMCMIVNLVSLLRTFRWRVEIFVGILRLYAVVFAAFVAIAETEWQWVFRHWPFLEYWVGRGMLQIFVAIMTKALAGVSWEVRIERLIHNIASWMLLGCGFIYTFAGVLCMRQLKQRRIQKRQWREQAVKDLQELEAKKREIEGLLQQGGRV